MSGGQARGPGTGMQDVGHRKRDRNIGHGVGTSTDSTWDWGHGVKDLQAPARLPQPPGWRCLGLAGPWTCCGG